jgi:hypothetical protein
MRVIILIVLSLSMLFTACNNEDLYGSKHDSSNILGANEEANLVLSGDGEYEKVITKPIVKIDGCKYIVEGTIEYYQDGVLIAVVDFGNGNCDNIATKTIDGVTSEFTLDKNDGKGKDDYTKIITKPLVKIDGCDYIVEGTIEYYKKNGPWVATVDYGDGTCDEWATKTWDGGSATFSLNDGKSGGK